jgi:hypothetical protein
MTQIRAFYCSIMEAELNTLYDEVQQDLSNFYRAVNDDDEAGFSAKLTPAKAVSASMSSRLRTLGSAVSFASCSAYPQV